MLRRSSIVSAAALGKTKGVPMRWPHYEHIFFDCDSTLTTVEGIDVLADTAGKRWRVEVLTQAAMEGELDLEDIYDKRMRAVKPSRQQIRDIRRAYKQNIVEDARDIITVLQELGHKVYIISGGLLEPVLEFGVFLGVPKEHIRAVEVSYNELSGNWWVGGDEQYLTFEDGALTVSDGKAQIVQEFLDGKRGRSLLVGDGYSDLLAGSAVNLFAGFGGVVQRERVLQEAPVFISSNSLAPILAVAAGPAAVFDLNSTEHKVLGQKSLELIERGAIKFNSQQVEERFNKAFQAALSQSRGGAAGDPGRPTALEDWTANA